MKTKLGVLSGEEIEDLKIICEDTFYPKSLKSASYDLRLGNKCYYYDSKKIELEDMGCQLEIEPYTSVLITTMEILCLPDNVVGRFDLRITYALRGLILQVGPQIEPGTNGFLFALLTNMSGKTVCLNQGEPLFTAEFSYLNRSVKISKEPRVVNEWLKSNVPKRYIPLSVIINNLDKAYSKATKKHSSIMMIIVPLITSIMIPFIVLLITKSSFDRGTYPAGEIDRLVHHKDSLEQRIIQIENCLDTTSLFKKYRQ